MISYCFKGALAEEDSSFAFVDFRAVHARPEPINLAKPPVADLISARTEGLVGWRQISVLKN